MKFKKIYALFLSTVIVTTNCANAFDPGNTGADSSQHGSDNDHAVNPDGPASPTPNAFLSDKLFVPRFGSSLGDYMFDDSIYREASEVAHALHVVADASIKRPGLPFQDGLKLFNNTITSRNPEFSHLLCNSLSDNVTGTYYVNGQERMYTFESLMTAVIAANDASFDRGEYDVSGSSAGNKLARAVLAYVHHRHRRDRLEFTQNLPLFSQELDLIRSIGFRLSRCADATSGYRFRDFMREYFVAMHAALLPDEHGHLKNNTAMKACLRSGLPLTSVSDRPEREEQFLNLAVEHALALREFYFPDDARARGERLTRSNCSQTCASVSPDEFAATAFQSVATFIKDIFDVPDVPLDDTFLKNAIKQLRGTYSLATDDDAWRDASTGTTGGSAAPLRYRKPANATARIGDTAVSDHQPDTGHIAEAAITDELTPPLLPFHLYRPSAMPVRPPMASYLHQHLLPSRL